MVSVSRRAQYVGILVFLFRGIDGASEALSVTPSTNWYGDDGTWSAVSLRVGTPPQWIDVMVSTTSSETWVIGPGGCNDNSLCASNRGELFDKNESSTWEGMGFFELGVAANLGNTGYAEYGLDSITFGSTGVTLPSAIIGSLNSTGSAASFQTWLGFFGLGIVPGSFANEAPLSALSALAETQAAIPSHSYGYTAGAKYQQKGVPNSLTLGGYDANRFVPHGVEFNLNPSQQPQVYLDSISVVSASASTQWTNPMQLLSTVDRVSAVIDSSTPYLWLPEAVCEKFAEILGLSYNSSLNLYTFDANSSKHNALVESELSFIFSLSDISTAPDVINITLPYSAFDLQLTFPAIPNTTYGGTDATKYYFPLRQAKAEAQYTIGRSFLQEAYLIVNYETKKFSVHTAVHTADPMGNTSIVAISRTSNSTLSGPNTMSSNKFPTAALAGVTVSCAIVVVAIILLLLFLWRRRRQSSSIHSYDKSSIASPPARGFLARLLHRNHHSTVHETNGSHTYATEVGADSTHARYELPAAIGPAELDSESGSLDGSTETGSSTQDTSNLSAYERARRKLVRQQAALRNQESYPAEKTENDESHVLHYRAPENATEIVPPLVSPMGAPESLDANSAQPSPVSPAFMTPPIIANPPPTYRRINPSNVVYVGRLPDNVQLPTVVPKLVGRDGRTISAKETRTGETEQGTDSLGSNYTTDEERRGAIDLYGSEEAPSAISPVSDETGSEELNAVLGNQSQAADPVRRSRRYDGDNFIHVPQPAQNRYSWEEERISGKDDSI